MSAQDQYSGGIPAAHAGGIVTVDLSALQANWRLLRDRAGLGECAAVVKADAYGIGLEPAVAALTAAGCRTFFVAHLFEAIRARAVAPSATIYVLNGLFPGVAGVYAAHGLRPVLGSLAEIEDWATFCTGHGGPLPAALHADTGMNRLGLRAEQALALASSGALSAFTLALIMTHLVGAEDADNAENGRQREAFARVCAAYPNVPASFANSSGLFLAGAGDYALARPGYALYGGNPTPGAPNPMNSVVTLQARIIQIREVFPGERVGYNGQWSVRGQRRLATIGVGYADGYPRSASGTDRKRDAGEGAGCAIVAGVHCSFAGRVSMDLISLDITAVPEGAVQRGDLVTLIGPDLTIDEVGQRAGTIGYEILTSLGRRYARHYVGG